MTTTVSASLRMSLDEAGFALLDDVFTPSEVAAWNDLLARHDAAAGGDLLARCAEIATMWQQAPLPQVVHDVLGPAAGLTRATWFDKTTGHSWAAPWHKDVTLAVEPPQDGHRSDVWGPSHDRDGVVSSEAPLSVLRKVVQLRINLDDQTDRNGALAVLPGSQRDGKAVRMPGYDATPVYGLAGSVMVLRPLVAHASGHTRDEQAHRRVLALEFAASPNLPDGYCWRHFHPTTTLGE